MLGYVFTTMDYVVSGIHLALLVGLLIGGLYMIYRGISNQKI
jgi:L-asparagine transporter-like permease